MMTRPLFSVVIPTIGRPTLMRTLLSFRSALLSGVAEAIIVADTHGEVSIATLGDIRVAANVAGARFFEFDAGQHDTGSPQIHMGFMQARGCYLLNCGDDDVYEPGAFDMLARVVRGGWPLMFRTVMYPNSQRGCVEPETIWREPRIERFNVTGQGFVCPNDPRRMGRWVDDVTFMRETVALHGGRIEWRDETIARCY